ncbi:recombinase family protein [Sabulicella glaciei]|uniref:Recombinase family protein n=1 Tax=Sabulicella glaciei TaxID=2984948 RepID=A0ABT3P1H0_9PROT|nr:recombinase family protein [Roseococcus sp. MDT2-1-1]MCW8088264.1 recombinase family protein [Roseococcus sp. MDT2-1-1]
MAGRRGAQSPAGAVRTVIYVRFSSENQSEASVDDQIRICRARAEREGWVVENVFVDAAISGATALRPGYQALLAAMRTGRVDVVLSESLDRLSRDQEHVASLYKLARFAAVRIITLAEGEVSELHVGLKGTMGALFLKDLADKTRRGLEGRVLQGRSGGGLCYGYCVVRGSVGRNGEAERGLREIHPAEAEVVREVFRRFADGESPVAIVKTLNARNVPSPRDGVWSDGALRGQAKRGTGILRNRIYIGELVWNQRRWLKSPDTGLRVARDNPESAVIVTPVPELRIIDQELWDRVQARLASAARPRDALTGEAMDHLWQHRRAPNLLSGKVRCGSCGAPFITAGKDYMSCKAMAKQGTCGNRTRVRRTRLETQILDAMADDLMQPDALANFVAGFTTEWNRLVAVRTAEIAQTRQTLGVVTRKLNGLINALADGYRAPGLQAQLDNLSAEQAQLQAEIDASEAVTPLPRLHSNLSEVYRQRVARLREELGGETAEQGVIEAARALIDCIVIFPPTLSGGAPRIEVRGELSALLGAAGVPGLQLQRSDNAKTPPTFVDGVCSRSGDAGTGFEPVTFRL